MMKQGVSITTVSRILSRLSSIAVGLIILVFHVTWKQPIILSGFGQLINLMKKQFFAGNAKRN